MKNKIAIFGIIVQLAGLIYGIVNKAEDIIVMCLIFMFISFSVCFSGLGHTRGPWAPMRKCGGTP